VKLRNFFQGDIRTDAEGAIQELMRAILVRAQFVPGTRHALGWRGLQQSCAAEVEGWTARIAGYVGVFGLYFIGIEHASGWVVGTFGLNYFPAADEALVERCSLHAVAFTQNPDYTFLVREFLHHKEMTSFFSVGTVFLALDLRQQALYLGMESLTAQRSIARDGVHLPQDGHMVQVIEPGGYDQDFPALSVTQAFFDALAASLVFHLEQSPRRLFERRFPGTEIIYDNVGSIRKIPASDIDEVIVGLGYGESRFDDLFEALTGTSRAPTTEIRWRETEALPPDYEHMRWWDAHQTSDYKTFDKKSMGIDERPPLMILSGFLGAGKTSFLQHFIEYQTQRSRFVAVIQNEIGEIGLDGKLLDYTVTEIDEGCVCCSLVGNLKRAVHGILSSFQPDFIILETTGAANTLNLLYEISELEALVRYDCSVTVVDAMNLDFTLSRFAVAGDQIRAADILLLNKCDLVSETCLQKARKQLQDINPKAVVFMTTRGDLNPAMIFDMEDQWEKNTSLVLKGSRFPVHSSHVHDGLLCKTLEIKNPLNRKEFLSAVESFPSSVFRVKGIIEFSDSPQPMLFQYVAGRFELSLFPQPTVTDRFLTFITQGEEFDLVGKVWEVWKTGMAFD
jgi:G3E family GTPase